MLKGICRFILRQTKRKEMFEELDSMSDRELADIGISRCDIPNIIEEAIKNENF